MLDFAKIDIRTFLIKKLLRLSARLDVTKYADIKLEFQICFCNLPSFLWPLDIFVHKVLLQPKRPFKYYVKMFVAFLGLHSSLLTTFGLNAASTYDSYLQLIFGKFALI